MLTALPWSLESLEGENDDSEENNDWNKLPVLNGENIGEELTAFLTETEHVATAATAEISDNPIEDWLKLREKELPEVKEVQKQMESELYCSAQMLPVPPQRTEVGLFSPKSSKSFFSSKFDRVSNAETSNGKEIPKETPDSTKEKADEAGTVQNSESSKTGENSGEVASLLPPFSFDEQPDLSTHPGPSPALILQV